MFFFNDITAQTLRFGVSLCNNVAYKNGGKWTQFKWENSGLKVPE